MVPLSPEPAANQVTGLASGAMAPRSSDPSGVNQTPTTPSALSMLILGSVPSGTATGWRHCSWPSNDTSATSIDAEPTVAGSM